MKEDVNSLNWALRKASECEIHKSLNCQVFEKRRFLIMTKVQLYGNKKQIHKFHRDLFFSLRLVGSKMATEKAPSSPSSVVPGTLSLGRCCLGVILPLKVVADGHTKKFGTACDMKTLTMKEIVSFSMAVILFGILGSYLFLHIWENILLK